MRTFGYRTSFDPTAVVRGFALGLPAMLALSGAVAVPSLQAQTAPYVLPYNMTTVAGPNTQFTAGAPCSSTSSLIALDTDGDGCLGPQASIGTDPHDVRVDYQGFVYVADNNASNGVIHRINPYTGQYTVYFNNDIAGVNHCTAPVTGITGNNGDGAGGGCISSDLLSNTGTTLYTGVSGAIRGLAVSPTNDVYSAFYTNSIVQRITGAIYTGSTSGHLVVGVAGTKGKKSASATATTTGVYGTGLLNQARGVGVGPDGTVYVADSTDNNLRSVTPNPTNTTSGTLGGYLTATNATPVYTTTGGTNVGLSSATLATPEDAQVDLYGNLIIADQADNLVRAVYHYAKASTTATQTSFFGITSGLVPGNIYAIAGTGAPPPASSSCTAGTTGTANATAYANFTFTNGVSNSLPGTSVPIQLRKIGLDPQGNVYIADNCAGVVYFLDGKTGGLHVVAGLYKLGQSTTPLASNLCAASTDAVGDGCPGTQASLDPTNMGTQPDTQGNLYISDSEGGSASLSRIRKLTNGLNFPPTSVGGSVTQGVLVHFAANDTVGGSNGFVVPSSDFSLVGSPSCTTNTATDKTSDCVAMLKFTPSQPGYQTSTLTVNSVAGGTVTYRISGVGTTAALAYDPGNTTLLSASVSGAQGVAVDGQGNAYVADTGNSRILLTSAAGSTTVLVSATAGLKAPKGLALGTDGSLYIADTGNNLIRKFSNGVLSTIGGGGTVPNSGSVCFTTPYSSGAVAADALGDGCPAVNASFSSPAGIATDYLGNVFVADTGNHIVRQIATNGYVTQLLTNFSASAGNSSPFSAPAVLAFDAINSNLIVADSGNSTVYSINLATTAATPLTAPPTAIKTNPVTVIAGNGQNGSSVGSSGIAINSQLSAPTGVAVDASGNIYIADTGNNAVRLVTPIKGTNGGVISTIAGILGSQAGAGSLGGTAAITAYSYTTNATTNVSTVTLTANNSFTAGTAVTFTGLTGATFLNNQNLSVQPGGTTTQFQVQYAGTIASPPPAAGTETGTATSTSLATATLLSAPGGVAVTPLGNLIVADSGNNRLLYDSRSQVSYNFGRVNLTSSSSTQSFTAVNVGTAGAMLNGLTTTPASTTFTLTGCSVSTLALGATCGLTGQFTPAATGLQSASFTDASATPALPGNPSITLSGTGAQLTPTGITVVQTVPATGNPPYGAPITLQATVTAPTCNTSAPSCVPSGAVTFNIDNVASQGVTTTAASANSATASYSPTGLSVGQHTVTCTFTPDSTDNSYYASSSCSTNPALIITVTQGSSTAVLSFPAGSNNQPQYPPPTPGTASTFTQVVLSVQVASVPPSGVPTGTVTFYSGPGTTNPIGTGTVSPTTGIATLTLSTAVDSNGNVLSNNTLLPGTYTLSCKYSGDTNYSSSICPGVSFTVAPEAATLSLKPRGCVPSSLYQPGTSTPLAGGPCVGGEQLGPDGPLVAVGQGATTDVTLFITPANTVSGTLTFSCSGLPANSVCTFSPQSITLTAGTSYPQPIYTDVTLWTDIPPGVIPSKAEMKLPGHRDGGVQFAVMLGWPLTLLGFLGLWRFRRSARSRGLTLMALALLMVGSTLTLSGCAGPGIYKPNLTPTNTAATPYVVTITVSGANVSPTPATVDFVVTPGIAGQQ